MIRTPEAKERALARSRAWKERNRERVSESRKRYAKANRERENANNRAWHERNPEASKRLAEKRGPYVRDWQALRKAERYGSVAMFNPSDVRREYGNECWACGSTERTGMDHIAPLKRGGSNFAFNVRLLCAACNVRKRTRMDHEVRDPEFRARLLLGHVAFTACFGRVAS